MEFPPPIALAAGTTRWKLSDLERYEAIVAGDRLPPPRDPATERYLSVKDVASRYGASVPTIWRWARAGRAA